MTRREFDIVPFRFRETNSWRTERPTRPDAKPGTRCRASGARTLARSNALRSTATALDGPHSQQGRRWRTGCGRHHDCAIARCTRSKRGP